MGLSTLRIRAAAATCLRTCQVATHDIWRDNIIDCQRDEHEDSKSMHTMNPSIAHRSAHRHIPHFQCERQLLSAAQHINHHQPPMQQLQRAFTFYRQHTYQCTAFYSSKQSNPSSNSKSANSADQDVSLSLHNNHDQEAVLKQLKAVGRLMDMSFSVPGTKFKVGLDSSLGRIPFAGERSCVCIRSCCMQTHVHVEPHVFNMLWRTCTLWVLRYLQG